MKTRTWIIIASAALVLTAALALPYFTARTTAQTTDYAQGTGIMSGQAYGPGAGKQRGPGQGNAQATPAGQQIGTQQSLLAVAAQVLGMTQDQLLTQLQPDKSIADLAGDKTQAVIDTFVQQQSERINAMVTAGRLTQADADQRLAAMRGMVTGRVYQNWATGVQGPPEGMAVGQGQAQGNGQGAGMGRGQGNGQGAGMGRGQGNGQGAGMGRGQGNGQGAGMGRGAGMGHGTGDGSCTYAQP